MGDIIEDFFSLSFENKVNRDILYYSYPEKDVSIYVRQVISEPILNYIEFIENFATKDTISAKDVFQFSNLSDATDRLCKKMEQCNNPGISYIEAGKMLLDDGKERKDSAYTKYGENHVKTAVMLGLSFELCHTYFLSCMGYQLNKMKSEDRAKLLVRLTLRNKMITRIYQASQNGVINMRDFLFMLSDSTYARRKSNIKTILKIIKESPEYDFSKFVDLIKF